MIVVVDTNIVFSALLSPDGKMNDILLNSDECFSFYAPDFLIEEIENHQLKIIKISGYTVDQLKKLKLILFKKICFMPISSVKTATFKNAHSVLKDIDVNDTPFLALAFELDALLWTGDKKLVTGLSNKEINQTITTMEISEIRNLQQ